MNSITDEINKLKKQQTNPNSDIVLLTVEENIALWYKKECKGKRSYFYSDLNGNILFNGQTFEYATAFSNSCAFVQLMNHKWYIIDLKRKELISPPASLLWQNISCFRNNNLALLDNSLKHWGSYYYNPEEKTFELEIPFIWDTIEFSRTKNMVYVGLKDVALSPIHDPYFSWEENHDWLVKIPITKLEKQQAYDYKLYQETVDDAQTRISPLKVRYIKKDISFVYSPEEKEKKVQETITTAYNIADFYFEERHNKELNNNDGSTMEIGQLNDYQKILGKLKK